MCTMWSLNTTMPKFEVVRVKSGLSMFGVGVGISRLSGADEQIEIF